MRLTLLWAEVVPVEEKVGKMLMKWLKLGEKARLQCSAAVYYIEFTALYIVMKTTHLFFIP